MAYIGFKKLAAKTSPAIAAAIGRKKYGKKKFQKAAKEGKTMENEKPLQEGGAVNVVSAKKRRKLEGIKKSNQLKNKNKTKENAFKSAAKATTKSLFPNLYKGVFKGSPAGEYVTEAIMRKQNKRKGGIISKLQTGGIAQGKSPGVDTPTTIDGTTYYQEGGKTTLKKPKKMKKYQTGGKAYPKTAKTAVDSAAYASGRGWDEEYKRLGGGKAGITLNKHYEQGEEDKRLDKISKAFRSAKTNQSAFRKDEVKARVERRKLNEQKQKSKFKKGGKMKYQKGGLLSKVRSKITTGGVEPSEDVPTRRENNKAIRQNRRKLKRYMRKGSITPGGVEPSGDVPTQSENRKAIRQNRKDARKSKFQGTQKEWNQAKPSRVPAHLQKGGLAKNLFNKKKIMSGVEPADDVPTKRENRKAINKMAKEMKTVGGKKVKRKQIKRTIKNWQQTKPGVAPTKPKRTQRSDWEDMGGGAKNVKNIELSPDQDPVYEDLTRGKRF